VSEYLDGVARADSLALQKQHHVPDLALGPPGVGDHRDALCTDARHLGQTAPVVLDDLQGVLSEAVHDAAGHHRPQPLDETRAQISADSIYRGGNLRGEPVDLELLPEPRVLGPLAVHVQNLAGDGCQQVADHGHRLTPAGHPHLGNGEPGFLVGERDVLDLPGDAGRHGHTQSGRRTSARGCASGMKHLMSITGEPSRASMASIAMRLPSTPRMRQRVSPMRLGRIGECVAKTPVNGLAGS
jgi:hypothetical protein